jgi:hypothetical protein
MFILTIILLFIAKITGVTYILPQHDLVLLSHIMMFFLNIFYTVTVLVYIYCMILLYSDLSTTTLTLKWLRKEHSRSLRMALFCRNM